MRKKYQRRPWQEHELRKLKAFYANVPTADLAQVLKHAKSSVYNKARSLGLRKSPELIAAMGSKYSQHPKAVAQRYKKGNVPPNKGIKGWQAGGRSHETRFKKGHMPQTWKPVGSERMPHISKGDDTIYVKISDKRNVSAYKNWKSKHQLIYEQHHGPVPKGHFVRFKDGNNRNFDINNLILVSRSQNMRMNSMYRYPKEVQNLIKLRGALNRKINERGGKIDGRKLRKQKRYSGTAQASV